MISKKIKKNKKFILPEIWINIKFYFIKVMRYCFGNKCVTDQRNRKESKQSCNALSVNACDDIGIYRSQMGEDAVLNEYS